MAWNEPGGGRDPWGGGRRGDDPQNLDEIIKNLQKKFSGLFGGSSKSDSDEGENSGGGGIGLAALLVVVLLVWVATGFYIIGPAERGVVQRFGALVKVTDEGPNWHLPYPIESVTKVNIDRVHTFPEQAHMLTKDENIVDLQLTVQYRIKSPEIYLFRDSSPEKSIQESTESALREVVGQNPLDDIIAFNRSAISMNVEENLRTLIERYQTGLELIGVNIQFAGAPDAVKAAFDDVNKAREDKERFENKAQAYSNDIIPKARGAGARRLEDAKAYRAKVIHQAEGESARFLALLAEYQNAPEVTRRRLYLETAEAVYAGANKILMDENTGNTLTYIPLDRLIKQRFPNSASVRLPTQAEIDEIIDDTPSNNTGVPPRDTSRDFGRSRGEALMKPKFIGLLLGLVVIVLVSMAFTVDEREVAIKLRLGEIVETDIDPGLHFRIPLYNRVHKFDRRIQSIDSRPQEFLTAEKKFVIVDSFIKWRVKQVEQFYRSTRGDMQRASTLISERINTNLRDEFAKRTLQEVISSGRSEIMELLTDNASKKSADLGVEIIDVRIKKVDFPEQLSEAIYSRMRTERERAAKELRAQGSEAAERIRAEADRNRTEILAEAYRDAEKMRGEGDAQSAEIYARAFNQDPEFYDFWRSLDSYRKVFENGGDVMLLNPNSEFFQYLNQHADQPKTSTELKPIAAAPPQPPIAATPPPPPIAATPPPPPIADE